MGSPRDVFSVILVRDGEIQVLFSGRATTITSEDPDIDRVYISLQCQECSMTSLVEGYIRPVATEERPMGKETIHTSLHDSACPYCGSRIWGEVEFSEYPRNSLQPYQFLPRENVDYIPIPGLNNLLSDIGVTEPTSSPLDDEIIERALNATQGEKIGEILQQLSDSDTSSVLILGDYGEWKNELTEVRDIFRENSFEAYLLEDLPDVPSESLADKSTVVMKLVDFCIYVDRDPSGAIDEYRLGQINNAVMARLVPESGGSTAQIGGREIVDINNIESFEFETEPQEVLGDAVEWAINYLEKRREAFDDEYGWRDED